MPIATITTITRLEHLVEYWRQKLEDNKVALGLEFVGAYDEPIKTAYPAVVIGSGNTNKTVHGIGKFALQFNLDFYICHAEANDSHRKRSLDNLEMVTKIVRFLEADYRLGERIIFGYVLGERPGIIQPRTTPSRFVVGTIINYQATLEVSFHNED